MTAEAVVGRSPAVEPAPDAQLRAAAEVVADLVRVPAGRTTASVYETARLVSLAPWVRRHAERIRFLLNTQRADGGWGGPDGYWVVPTLSATEGLLAALDRDEPDGWSRADVTGAVHRALARLHERLGETGKGTLPDLPAADLIVPGLVERIGRRLARPPVELSGWNPRLPLPPGLDRGRLDRVRRLVDSGAPLPDKLLHALEAVGPGARRHARVRPGRGGAVGASPAATAGWIGTPDAGVREAVSYLERAVDAHAGPVPCATPITVFERSWTLAALARAGVPVQPPQAVLDSLRAAVGPGGAATGPGLPTDADTTAVTLYALARFGQPVDPASLWSYDTGVHFDTWPGEDGASVTTNAHVLEVLGWHLARAPGPAPRLAAAVGRLTDWLVDRQAADGRWSDRWHASPYYAASCAAAALARYGGPRGRPAVARAVRWVLGEQRADGTWGRWDGTAEETAYAVQVLAAAPRAEAGTAVAATRAAAALSGLDGAPTGAPLWHDKDLYQPPVIVRAAVVAARWQATRLATVTDLPTGS